jgi:hypothetical protein
MGAVQQQVIEYIDGPGQQSGTIQYYIDEQFEYKKAWKWPAFAISLAFVIVLRFVVALATKYLHFQKR